MPALELVVNRTLHYVGRWGGHACCGLRVYRSRDGHRPDVVIVTETAANEGESVRHAGARLLGNVCHAHGLDPECLHWVEHLPAAPEDCVRDPAPERFWLVTFGAGRAVARVPIRRAHVERLVGGPLHAPAPA